MIQTVTDHSVEAVSLMKAASLAGAHLPTNYKERVKLSAFKKENSCHFIVASPSGPNEPKRSWQLPRQSKANTYLTRVEALQRFRSQIKL